MHTFTNLPPGERPDFCLLDLIALKWVSQAGLQCSRNWVLRINLDNPRVQGRHHECGCVQQCAIV